MSIHHPLRFNWHQFEGAGIDSSARNHSTSTWKRSVSVWQDFSGKDSLFRVCGGGSLFQSTLLNPTYLLLRENYRFITFYINHIYIYISFHSHPILISDGSFADLSSSELPIQKVVFFFSAFGLDWTMDLDIVWNKGANRWFDVWVLATSEKLWKRWANLAKEDDEKSSLPFLRSQNVNSLFFGVFGLVCVVAATENTKTSPQKKTLICKESCCGRKKKRWRCNFLSWTQEEIFRFPTTTHVTAQVVFTLVTHQAPHWERVSASSYWPIIFGTQAAYKF